MLTLVFDCAHGNLTLVLIANSSIIAFHDTHVNNQLSQSLLPQLDLMLRASKHSLSQISQVSFARGPGSFTALRIGLAFLKGLFLRQNIHFTTFSALELRCLQLARVHGGDASCAMPLGRGRHVVGMLLNGSFTQQICDAQQWQHLSAELQHKNIVMGISPLDGFDAEIFLDLPCMSQTSQSDLSSVSLEYVIEPDIG